MLQKIAAAGNSPSVKRWWLTIIRDFIQITHTDDFPLTGTRLVEIIPEDSARCDHIRPTTQGISREHNTSALERERRGWRVMEREREGRGRERERERGGERVEERGR